MPVATTSTVPSPRIDTAAEFAAVPREQFGPIGRSNARAAFLVAPDGFALAHESAGDNAYMDLARSVDPTRALAQHRGLQRALSGVLPTIAFAGSPDTPDAVFPNNVFGTVPGRLVLGSMRHPVRRREADRHDIRRFFGEVLGYETHDLRQQPGVCELTGSMVIDRARGIGFIGLSPRCDPEGADAMHAAFDLRLGFRFALNPEEYHANVVMSVLASRALVICPDAFADPAAAAAIAAFYAPHVIELGVAEKNAFAGNCIALSDDIVWMSEAAADRLRGTQLLALERAGFRVSSVALDEIEKAGGSLRCCVGELF